MLKVLLSVSFVSCALVFTGVASTQAASIVPLTCSSIEITAAKDLAHKVKALGKNDPAGALKIAEDVALRKSKCFQTAFGNELDGTGTASIGGPPGTPPPGDVGGGDPGNGGNNSGGNGCVNAEGTCPASRS